MAVTLNTYISECRRLLHDANANFYSSADLTLDINAARSKVASDTHCLRTLVTANLATSQETYIPNALLGPVAGRVIDVVNITVLWGSMRVPLLQMIWTEFNATVRVWTTNQSRPVIYSKMGGSPQTIYVQPLPDQAYASEWDVAYTPIDLVDGTSVEELAYPFTAPVAFYACHLAKYNEQSFGEAELFLKQYQSKAFQALNQVFTRVLPNPYA